MDIPYVTHDMARLFYEASEALVLDDKHDLGYFTYKNRKSHKYHGRLAPNHESPYSSLADRWTGNSIIIAHGSDG